MVGQSTVEDLVAGKVAQGVKVKARRFSDHVGCTSTSVSINPSYGNEARFL